ncbi:MAG: PEGA domain-containing protein [Verrucomicrobiota bacterium]
MKLKNFRSIISLIAGLCMFAGCATVTGGLEQDINIDSKPQGATVLINGVEQGKTPITVELSRKTSHLVEISMPGYKYYEITVEPKMNNAVYGNILAGGAIGMMVDGSNGASNSLHPDEILAILEKR